MNHEKNGTGPKNANKRDEAHGTGPRERTIAHIRQILAKSGVAKTTVGIVACEHSTIMCDPLPSPTPPKAACTQTIVSADQNALSAMTLASSSFRTETPGRLKMIVD
jgi:hypothetical protein